jgi:hypothetical protein
MLPHDAVQEAESYQLEFVQKFLGKRLTVVFRYKDVEEGPERTFVGVITEVGFSQEKGSLGDIVVEGSSPTALLDAAPTYQSFGGPQPISLNSIADYVIKQGINPGFMIFVSLQNMEIWIIAHSMKRHIITTCPVWQKPMENSFFMMEKYCISENFHHRKSLLL